MQHALIVIGLLVGFVAPVAAASLLDLVDQAERNPTVAWEAYQLAADRAELEGDEPGQRMVASMLLERQGRLQEALRLLEPFVHSDARIRSAPLQALTVVLVAPRDGELASVGTKVRAALGAIRLPVVQAMAAVVAGHDALAEGATDRAVEHVEEARRHLREAAPDKAYRTWQTALVASRLATLQRLAASAERITELGPVLAAFQAADRARAAGDLATAEAEFARIIADYPDHFIVPHAHYGVIRCLLARGSYDQAVDRYRAVVQPHPWLAIQSATAIGDHAFEERRQLIDATGWWREGLRHIARVDTEAEETHMLAPTVRARLLQEPLYVLQYGHPAWRSPEPGRIPALHRPATMATQQFILSARLVASALCQGDRRAARTYSKAALLYDHLATSHREHGATTGAMLLAEAVHRGFFLIPPSTWDTVRCNDHVRHALIFAGMADALCDWAQAESYARRAVRASGDAPGVVLIARYLQARAAVSTGRQARARELLTDLALEPDDELPLDLWARAMGLRWSHLHQDDQTLAEAIAGVDSMIAHAPRHPDTLIVVGGAGLVLAESDPERALRYLEILQRLDPARYHRSAYPRLEAEITARLKSLNPSD
jgi:tetratricopeptide (TPR) repeat protein